MEELHNLINRKYCMKNRIEGLLHVLKRTGFFSVFLSSILSKIISFLGGVIIVRILSKNDYGLYTYVMNCYSMLFILNDFGCNVAMIQFRSENYADKRLYNEYYTFSFKCAVVFSAMASLLIVLSPFFYPFKQNDAALLTQHLCLLPILNTINTFQLSNLRVEMQNRKYALLNVFQVMFHYGFILPLSFFGGIRGAVMSNYLVVSLMILLSACLSRGYHNFDWRNNCLGEKRKKTFLKYAFASQINNSIGALLTLFDIFLIGFIISDNRILSSYKVSSTIPQALMFIPNSILVYAGPLFARNISNAKWIKRNFSRIIAGCLTSNGFITVFLVLFAHPIIVFLFGNSYTDAIPCFVILMLAFFIQGTFQIPAANVIYTQHKVKVNIVITIVSNILNCVLDLLLIQSYGAIGAAVATLLVSTTSSVIAFGYMVLWLNQNVKEA